MGGALEGMLMGGTGAERLVGGALTWMLMGGVGDKSLVGGGGAGAE